MGFIFRYAVCQVWGCIEHWLEMSLLKGLGIFEVSLDSFRVFRVPQNFLSFNISLRTVQGTHYIR